MYTSLPLITPYPVITPSDGVSLVLMLKSVLLALTKAPISTKLLSSRIDSILAGTAEIPSVANAEEAENAKKLGGQLPAYYAKATDLNKYLPLSGGTVTGASSITKILGKSTSTSLGVYGLKGLTSDGSADAPLYLNQGNSQNVYINNTSNLVYQNLRILVGYSFLDKWVKDNEYIMDYFEAFKNKLESKYKKAVITLLSVSLVLFCTTLAPVSKDLEVIAFDVQNADSFLIKTPQQKYFFIDTGKAPYRSGSSQAKIIMLKYLKDRGIKNIKGVIVTHFDNDHSGGTCDIIKNEKVAALYLNNANPETQTARNIFKTSKEIHQKIKFVKNDNIIYKEPNLTMKTFKVNIGGKDASNASSTVTLLSYKNFDMLFMADAGVVTFNRIKHNLPHNVEVLKVGHHGGPNVVSKSMTDYLDTKVSVVSTGINYFGHPNKGTLDILRNTLILRTDMLNSVKISTDGNIYKIYSYDNQDKKYKIKETLHAKK